MRRARCRNAPDQAPQRLAHDLPVHVPQRHLHRRARHRVRRGIGQRGEGGVRVARMRERLGADVRRDHIADDALVLGQRLGQVPVRPERDAFADACATGRIAHLDEQRLALPQHAARRGEWA